MSGSALCLLLQVLSEQHLSEDGESGVCHALRYTLGLIG
jgi:hypothetical protein